MNASRFDIELEFPVDRGAYRARLVEVAAETGLDLPTAADVTYTAHVEVSAAREGAGIRRVMEPSLVVPLGETPSFEISGNRQIANNGVLRLPEEVTRSGLGRQGGISMVISGSLVLVAVMFALVTSSQHRTTRVSVDSVARQAGQLRRRYRKRIAVGASVESELPGDQMVPVDAMPDLVKISEELLKPIIYLEVSYPNQQYLFYLVDGSTRYEYRLIAESNIDSDTGKGGIGDPFQEELRSGDSDNVLIPEPLPPVDD